MIYLIMAIMFFSAVVDYILAFNNAESKNTGLVYMVCAFVYSILFVYLASGGR